MVVIDCTSSPPFDAMRAAGVTGVLRYLSLPQANTVWKRITQTEYDQLRAAGFDVVLNWEYAGTDWLGGSAAGAQHAAMAVQQAVALGYPAGCAIPGSADFNMTAAQWQSAGRAYAAAYSQGIRAGGYVAGVYGPWDVLTWCQQLGGFGMFWQSMSTSWSGGRNAQQWPGAHLWQRRAGSIGGFDVDFNDQLQPWYGQYGVDAASTGGDVAFLDDPNAAALAWRVEGLANGRDAVTGGPLTGEDLTKFYGKVAAKVVADLPTVAPPTDDQVNAAVAKVMNDPAWLEQLAAAFASHFHVS